ncbi:Rad52/Rad22 family DNA repair protein [Halarcobacter bivalviorum]|uniref:Rad52/Rad22 family DNA repair protein n=1 Tax=Halarcobacter bivalviorum TaxID=663364 RepID=UPI00100A9353|nr:Rad52/Rad22 family DNA repair protein [Halarcobacter bivalviorum]RXK06481.1 DNA repair protein Rad52 [Halarcobacter bivalviorum]
MFNNKQLQILNSELDSSRIKTREKGNISLSYIEGHSAIETANNVFGFGNWDYAISKLEQVSQEVNQNQNNVVCYKAVVQVLVHSENHSQDVSREDVGFGTGVAKTLADAHEGAAKEAVTDALKRAMRSFGNQFGNSLYSKDKNHSNNGNYQNQQNYSQQSANNNYQQQQYNQSSQQQAPYKHAQDFSQLINLGLAVIQQGENLIVVGDNAFANKDVIKAHGFRWDTNNRQWYMNLRQVA